MAAGLPLVLSGSEFLDFPAWKVDRAELLQLRHRFRAIAADLSAKSAVAGRLSTDCRAQAETALRQELVGILKEREKQLRNPVGYEILQSIREKQRPGSIPETLSSAVRQRKLSEFAKPYAILIDEEEDSDDVRPFFWSDDVVKDRGPSSRAKRKTRLHKPLMQRMRGQSLQTRVQYVKEMNELKSNS